MRKTTARTWMFLLVAAANACAEDPPALGNVQDEPAPPGWTPPTFEHFPAEVDPSLHSVPVDLDSHPEARQFRTVLSRGAAQGPNFAGHLTVVTFACGTMCQRSMVVDAVTGRVVASLTAPLGFEFRPDSRLLVANPPSSLLQSPCPSCETRYYLWEERSLREAPVDVLWGPTPPPARERALVAEIRARERPDLARAPGSLVRRTGWDRLMIRTRDRASHQFRDEVAGGELRRIYRFAGLVEPIDAYVLEAVLVPEGRQFLLIDAGNGTTTEIDGPPVPSPDGTRFITANLDLIAGHTPNRIRIYRVGSDGPEVEWEVQPTGWGAHAPRWIDERIVELERGVLDEKTQQVTTSTMRLVRRDRGWQLDFRSTGAGI